MTLKASKSLFKLSRSLFDESEQAEIFAECLINAPNPAAAIAWIHGRKSEAAFKLAHRLEWQPAFVDRLQPGERPGGSPWHDQGCFYCLDFSSVFAAVPFLSAGEAQERSSWLVCDVCAAPGGKSILAYAGIKPQQLLCNEAIGKRTAALISNLRRCKVERVMVALNDTKRLAETCPQAFDLVIVDAPCSGQSLLARGEKAPGCLHPSVINLNSNRQKRIAANSVKLLSPGGYLNYMTCTFSRQENEGVLEWLLKRFPALEPVRVAELSKFQSHLTAFPCYRLWPQQGLGAGAFSALLKNTAKGERRNPSCEGLKVIWRCQ